MPTAGRRPAWFSSGLLKLFSENCVCVCMCTCVYVCMCVCTCNSCNMGMRALPDMCAQLPEGHRPEGRWHTYQTKPKCPVLQLICNTYQADSLYRAINHPSQYECSHWIYCICITKIFDYRSAATVVSSVMMNGVYPRDITENFGFAS